MKKLTIITVTITLFSSCGLKFGDYYRYQEVYGQEKKEDEAGLGDGHNRKVMKNGNKNKAVYNGKVINNWR